jgi:flagellar hook protein FlgE
LVGTPNSGPRGAVVSQHLEESNVDLAEEMVDMIITQRAFQANSKTVTTADSMLAEIIQMKR